MTMRSSIAAKRFSRQLLWGAFLAGALVVVGCSSGEIDLGAAAAGDGDSRSEAEQQVDDARSQLEELEESGAFGAGSGVITVEGVDYAFEARTCFIASNGFDAAGPGVTADGVPYWATLSTNVSTREQMLQSGLPEANVDAFFGDSDSIQSFGLEIELGKLDQFSSGDDAMSNFRVDVIKVSETSDVSFVLDGKTLSGTASVTDDNGVAMDYGVAAPASFSATCN